MRIGIIGAMEEEIKELKEVMNVEKIEKIGGFTFYIGEIEKKEVILVGSGIGKVNSSVCTTLLIQKYGIKSVIFTGVAGGVGSSLDIGDVVLATELIEHDFDCTAFGMKPGEIPRMQESIFKCDIDLLRIAEKSLEKVMGKNRVKKGIIVSGDQFIASKEKIKWLGETFNAQCTEMEGASVAHVCYLFELPFVVLRAVSDKADGSAHVDFKQFVNLAAQNSKNIVIEMLKNM